MQLIKCRQKHFRHKNSEVTFFRTWDETPVLIRGTVTISFFTGMIQLHQLKKDNIQAPGRIIRST
jgi:hypothetical protein